MAIPLNHDLSARMRLFPDQVARLCRLALKEKKGNVTLAAKELGISRRTLYRWIAEYPQIREDGAA